MVLLISIGRVLLNFIYVFHKICPVKNRILIVSRQNETASKDIRMLQKELKKQNPDIEVIVSCRMIPPDWGGRGRYLWYMVTEQMHLFATSKVVVLDGYCIVASILRHRKLLKIVQMWHAMGAMKQFGYCTVGKKEGTAPEIASAMRMHQNYDVIFVSSEACKPLLAPAYRCRESIMQVMPLPRTDLITGQDYIQWSRQKIYRRYPFLREKETILYAPTFRKKEEKTDYIYSFVKRVDYERYNLVVKLHPLVEAKVSGSDALFDTEFSADEMLSIADYVVTDYSAFVFEAALAGKPLFRYIPDWDIYEKDRGFLIDIDREFPGEQSQKADTIVAKIEQKEYDLTGVCAFARKYVEKRENCTQEMAQYILQLGR